MKVAIFNDTRTKDKHFGCEIVMRNLEKLLRDSDLQPVWYWPVGRDWRKSLDQLPKRGDIDAVIVNGEGSIHHSESRDRPDILADVAKMARNYLEVPAFLINATLYQNSPRIYSKFKDFKKIYVRDAESLKELEENGLEGEIVPDLTLSFPDHTPLIDRVGIGVTDSTIKHVNLDLKRACKQNNWAYCPMTVKIPKLPKIRDIAHPSKLARKVKRYITEWRLERLDREILSESPESPESFLSWLTSKEIIITGRYHTVTLCLLTKTPFVAVESNTPKISSLLRDVFGSNHRVVSKVSDLPKQELHEFSYFTQDESKAIEELLREASSKSHQMMISFDTAILQAKKVVEGCRD